MPIGGEAVTIRAVVGEDNGAYKLLFSRLSAYVPNLMMTPGGEFFVEDAQAEMRDFAQKLLSGEVGEIVRGDEEDLLARTDVELGAGWRAQAGRSFGPVSVLPRCSAHRESGSSSHRSASPPGKRPRRKSSWSATPSLYSGKRRPQERSMS